MSYIEFRDVVKAYGDHCVIDHVSLSIEQGSLVTLLGPSGCGKTTLLRSLAGLERIDSGSIWLDGTDVTNVPPNKRGIGMVCQQYSLFPNMTVSQNIAFGLKMQKMPAERIAERVAWAIELVELKGRENAYPANLSGGQQQRTALARSIVTEPKVLLLDEPFSAIDAKLRHELQARIREIHTELGLTTLFVTHDQDEAMIMSDVIELFNEGRIEQAGRPLDIYTHPATEFAASFIGSYNRFSPAEFTAMTGIDEAAEGIVAVRPETIRIAPVAAPPATDIVLTGRVTTRVPHSNVLRYTVEMAGVTVRVDTLFDGNEIFEVGDEVALGMASEDCLRIR